MAIHEKSLRVAVSILLLIVAGGFIPGAVHSQSSNLKIGSVDIQKAVNECNAGKEAKKTSPKRWRNFSISSLKNSESFKR